MQLGIIQAWYKDGKLHHEGGPAATTLDGTEFWYFNGLLHREDGPAIIRQDGTKEWWINGTFIRIEEVLKGLE